ncbi:MAG TPA: TlpA disulfide reductase family protein [Gemmataceae bacterium]
MRRRIGIMLAALLVAVPLAAQDKKADDKGKDRAQQFKELRTSFEKARREAIESYQNAKTDEEKKAAFEKYQNPGDQVAKVMKLIEADPKDDLAFQMLMWELRATQLQEPKVFDLLAEHHIKNPAMVDVCRTLSAMPSPEAAKLLRKVLDDSPEKSAKGCACYALAQLADSEANGSDPSKTAEAEKLYQRVIAEFADVKSGRPGSTLGELAKAESKLLIGKTAPDITSENLEGDKVQLKDYRGKVVVLDIWATWCGPCRAMIPHEREMVKKLKDKPFALVSISFDQKKDTLKKFLKEESMPWTHWWNGQEGGITKEYNIQHFPTIYVLDTKGVIRYKEIRGEQLEEAIEKLLAEGKDKE